MTDEKYGYSILFIEDEVDLRKNYVMYFETVFKSVYEASDGLEAYNIYKAKKPDILIVDINIPKMNGLELLQKIREYDHETKAIILTAHNDNTFLLHATRLKLTDYLIKPISRKALEKSLKKVIDELNNYKTIAIKNKIFKDDYIWCYDTNELTYKNTVVHLTNKERIILILFMKNLNSLVSTDEIIYSIWDEYLEGHEAALKTILKKLRKKLPKGMISNTHGLGYKISS